MPIYIEFILKSFSAFIIGSLDIHGDKLYDAFLRIALLNFILIGLFPFVNFLDSMNYMRFGYAIVPSVIMFFYGMLKEKKKFFWIVAGLVAFILMGIYGNRGTLVVIFLYGTLLFFYSKRVSTIKKSIIFGLSSILVFLISKYNLIIKLIDWIYFNLGIQTYAIAKFRMMFDVGFIEASSGRGKLYSIIWQYIKKKPLQGYGIGFSQDTLGYTPHNIFLQILLESGVIGFFIWIIILTYCLYKYKKIYAEQEEKLFMVATLIISLALGRLLISSDMWLRPEYWFALSMLLNFKYRHNFKKGMIKGNIIN